MTVFFRFGKDGWPLPIPSTPHNEKLSRTCRGDSAITCRLFQYCTQLKLTFAWKSEYQRHPQVYWKNSNVVRICQMQTTMKYYYFWARCIGYFLCSQIYFLINYHCKLQSDQFIWMILTSPGNRINSSPVIGQSADIVS